MYVVAWLDSDGTLQIEGAVGPFRSAAKAEMVKDTYEEQWDLDRPNTLRAAMVVPLTPGSKWRSLKNLEKES